MRISIDGKETKMSAKEEKAFLEQQRIDTEALQPKAPDVKAEAARRISSLGIGWMAERELSGGKPIPKEIKAAAQLIRDRSNKLEKMKSIPIDFRNDKYWE